MEGKLISATQPEPASCKLCGGPLGTGVLAGRCLACTVELTFAGEVDEPEPGARTFGGYELVEEIGRGGMGVVYRAVQAKLKRTVAIKLLLGGAFAGEEAARRFRQEAELAAGLHHAGIVPIYEAGEEDGQAFYAMEFVEGRSLAELTRGRPLAPLEAARCLQSVAQTVHYAHGRGVLHRDLKPSNILIDAFDQPRVADFGLARPLDEISDLTRTTDALGSPPYMAPEQATGRAGAAGVAADVYSLGAVLYHLLTGRPPFQGTSAAQILLQVERDAPLRPQRLNPAVLADLETICLKCLEKQPARRYASAAAMAQDLGRFLRGEPVLARPVGWAGRGWRWARRNPALAAMGAVTLLAVLGGTAAVLRQAVRNSVQKQENRDLAGSLRTSLYATDVFAAWQSFSSGDLTRARAWLAPHEKDPRRGVEWGMLWRAAQPRFSREIGRHEGYVQQLACSPDGRWLLSTGFDDRTRLWDLASDKKEPVSTQPFYAVTPQFLQKGTEAEARVIRARKLCTLAVPGGAFREGPAPEAGQISFSADGTRAAVGAVMPIFFVRGEGAGAVYETQGWTSLWEPLPEPVMVVTLSPDGSRVAGSTRAGRVKIWDVATRSAFVDFAAAQVTTLKFSTDGAALAAGGKDGAWLQRGSGMAVELPHPDGHMVTGVAFSDDGSLVATSCTDRGIRLWDGLTGALRDILWGHDREVWAVCFRTGSHEVVSGGKDGRVLVWDTQRVESGRALIPADSYQPPIFSADSRWMLAGHDGEGGHFTSLVAVAGGAETRRFPLKRLPVALSADGAFAILKNTATLEMEWWPVSGGEPVRRVAVAKPAAHIYQTTLSPDESTVGVLTDDGTLHLHPAAGPDAATHVVPLPVPHDGSIHVRTVRWSPDSRWIAIGTESRPYSAWLVDAASGAVRELPGQLDLVSGVAFSPDSQVLATGTSEGSILIWDVSDGRLLQKLPGHPRNVFDVCFSPDGRTLLSVGQPGELKCWHTGLWRELATFPLAITNGFHLAVSPDGKWIAVGSGEEGRTQGISLIETN